MKKLIVGLILLALIGAGGFYALGFGLLGSLPGPGTIEGGQVPPAAIAAKVARQKGGAASIGAPTTKQILFGDLHVHSTYSFDAFAFNLPVYGGEGLHPIADACDFARYCSSLDFWSSNDHVEGFTPVQWADTKESIRQCNAAAGDPANPDMVSFLGWEWTQVGASPADHYGHKNVIFLDTDEDKVPVRPIASRGVASSAASGPSRKDRAMLTLFADGPASFYQDFANFVETRNARTACEDGVDVHDLPADCAESTATPKGLFEKLNQWGYPSLVIPHGTTWGFYTPPGTSWDKQLTAEQNDPNLQRLFEVFSGHGNSEEYRPWRAVTFDDAGTPQCPAPSADYLPSCWKAGEIIRDRCLGDGESGEECEARAADARANYAQTGIAGYHTVPGTRPEEWLDAGQCKDCFLPAFNYRPGNSAQYTLALTNFDDPENPKRFRWGFIGSSDIHQARPGTGYKEFFRMGMVEGAGGQTPGGIGDPERDRKEPESTSIAFDPLNSGLAGFQLTEFERQSSFFMTGGLIAAHSDGRDRRSIWDAMQAREVYATSGDRILLWFDLVNAPDKDAPPPAVPPLDEATTGVRAAKVSMGGEAGMTSTPRFEVRAVGAFKQKPGCPTHATDALSEDRLQRLCRGECYNPSDERKLITHIEVVRVLPQVTPDEPVENLIQDPWRRFTCPADQQGCVIAFEDEEFESLGRDATYYVRAVEEPSPAVNGGQLRCEYNAEGQCIKTNACYKDYRTDPDDDCLADVKERAWSSPIYLTHDG